MGKKILTFIFGTGLIIGLIFGGSSLVTHLTFRNTNWYNEMQSKIYYVDRTLNNINLETDNLLKEHQISIPPYQKVFTRADINKIINQRNKTFANIKINIGLAELEALNISTLTEIENLVTAFVNQIETNDLTLTKETLNEIKMQLIKVAKQHIIRFDSIDFSTSNIEKRSIFITYFIYLMSDFSQLSYPLVILFVSILGIFILYSKSFYQFFFSLGLGFLVSGLILHVYSYFMIKRLHLHANEITTMTGELAYTSYLNRLGELVTVSKGIYLMSLILFLIRLTVKHYRYPHPHTLQDCINSHS